jgi:hypothetical protein
MLRKTKSQTDEPIELEDDDPIVPLTDDEPLTDEEIALGFYTTNEMVALGFVKDRQDQRRKQLKYGFPRPTKTGDRQAPTSKARVHRWVRQRDALSRTLLK